MERAFDADFPKEEDRYRARDGIAALLKPWFETRTLDEVRKALDEHGVCWGPYQTFTQLLDDDWRVVADEPGVRRRRPPRHRRAAHSGVAVAVPDRSAVPARAGTAARHPHRRGARRRARSLPRRDRTPARRRRGRQRSAARFVSVEPTLADTGFGEQADGTVGRDQAARLAACLDADPSTLDSRDAPTLWHWACFPPLVPTAGLGHDGHPRRRPEMEAFPQRMWVGGRVQIERTLRLDVDAARSSRIVQPTPKDGGGRSVLAGHRRPRISQDDQVSHRRGTGSRVPRASAVVMPAGPTATTTTPDADRGWRSGSPTRCCCSGSRPSPRTLTASTTTSRTRRRVEGYPDLVVHGPLTAILSPSSLGGRSDRAVPRHLVTRRVVRPHFANRPVLV